MSADVFHKMGVIEKWGTGLPRIFARCAKAGVPEPRIAVGGSTVSVCFSRPEPPLGEEFQQESKVALVLAGKEKSKGKGKEKPAQQILSELSDNPHTTIVDLATSTGLSVSGVEKHLRALKAAGHIQSVGPDRGGYWQVLAAP